MNLSPRYQATSKPSSNNIGKKNIKVKQRRNVEKKIKTTGQKFEKMGVLISAENVEQWPSHFHLAKAQTLNLFKYCQIMICSSYT